MLTINADAYTHAESTLIHIKENVPVKKTAYRFGLALDLASCVQFVCK